MKRRDNLQNVLNFTIGGLDRHRKSRHYLCIFAKTEPAWSDFGFIGNLDIFTFLTSVVVKSTVTLSIIVTDFDLLNNSFGIQQG